MTAATSITELLLVIICLHFKLAGILQASVD